MRKQSNQFVFICVTLCIAAVVSWSLYFKQAIEKDTVDINKFPKTIATWTSVDLPITKEEFAILETNNAFVRLYTNSVDKSQVYLYVVYSQNNRKVAHPPEICYTGSGMSIVDSTHDTIPVKSQKLTIQANRLRLSKRDLTHISFYWFKVGSHFTPNYWKQQALIAFYTLIGKKPSSALIRVSGDVTGDNMDQTIKKIKEFSSLITPKLFSYLP